MKQIIKFLAFLIYATSIFFIQRYEILIVVAVVNLSLAIILKINFIKALKNILGIFPFIIFTGIINWIATDFISAILITIKLIFVCNITYIFSRNFTYIDLAYVIEKIFYPLKIFKINSKEIGLTVCIGVAFIPILKREINQIKESIKVKGFELNLKNSNVIFKPFIISILKRINEIDASLKAKAYE